MGLLPLGNNHPSKRPRLAAFKPPRPALKTLEAGNAQQQQTVPSTRVTTSDKCRDSTIAAKGSSSSVLGVVACVLPRCHDQEEQVENSVETAETRTKEVKLEEQLAQNSIDAAETRTKNDEEQLVENSVETGDTRTKEDEQLVGNCVQLAEIERKQEEKYVPQEAQQHIRIRNGSSVNDESNQKKTIGAAEVVDLEDEDVYIPPDSNPEDFGTVNQAQPAIRLFARQNRAPATDYLEKSCVLTSREEGQEGQRGSWLNVSFVDFVRWAT